MAQALHIDPSGRLVIPKPLREACGIDETTPLEARRVGRELRLIPRDIVPHRAVLENGWIVFDTGTPHSTDLHAVVHDEYEARARQFST
ncbi:MAG TPA: AbrB/MazE/SpoVT family DNA-binding domain-containing protein [Gemmatimonadaceae bacterium]|nr:AbrB/MazE/SpoVT family DNA-binding domain-containing protein [Gemmatimonadaceae bacterium]